jgi:hypothetical protein
MTIKLNGSMEITKKLSFSSGFGGKSSIVRGIAKRAKHSITPKKMNAPMKFTMQSNLRPKTA